IANKYLPEELRDYVKDNVVFVLLDIKEPNAYFIPITSTPIIAFTKGLFITEDGAEGTKKEPVVSCLEDLVYVLLHEATHLNIYKEYKQKKDDSSDQKETGQTLSNSKFEEAAAYTAPIPIMADKGLNPEQALHTYKKLLDFAETPPDLKHLLDPHPLAPHTISAIEAALAQLKRRKGGLPSKAPKKFSAKRKLLQAAEKAKHTSYLEAKIRKIKGYHTFSPAKKLKALKDILSSMDEIYPIRIRDIGEEVKKIGAELENKKITQNILEAVDEFANEVLKTVEKAFSQEENSKDYLKDYEKRKALKLLYNALSIRIAKSGITIKPLGRLKPLASVMQELINAVEEKNSKKILQLCKELKRAAKEEPLTASINGLIFLQHIDFPGFKPPDIESLLESEEEKEEDPLEQDYYFDEFSEDEKEDLLEQDYYYDEFAEEEDIEDFEYDELDTDSTQPCPVSWASLRELAKEHEEAAEAAIIMGLYSDTAVQNALGLHNELAYRVYCLNEVPIIQDNLSTGDYNLERIIIDDETHRPTHYILHPKKTPAPARLIAVQNLINLGGTYFLEQGEEAEERILKIAEAIKYNVDSFCRPGTPDDDVIISKLALGRPLFLEQAEHNFKLFIKINHYLLTTNRDAALELIEKFREWLSRED
ncbi:MAG: hypothetical protein D6780_07535, partial [Candidatus Dadabacteria bacterium]